MTKYSKNRYQTKYTKEIKGLHNFAKFRAVYHSSAADFNHTGHLVTNGIKVLSNRVNNKELINSSDSKECGGSSISMSILKSDEAISRWQSAANNVEWIYVDFGCTKTIEKAIVLWDFHNYAVKYCLEASLDGEGWETILQIDDGTGGEVLLKLPVTNTRYVRLLASECAGSRYEIIELELYGKNKLSEEMCTINYQAMPELIDKNIMNEPASIKAPVPPAARLDGTVRLTKSWKLARASEVPLDGQTLSSAYDDSKWLPAVVPGTVLSSFRKNGSIPDGNYGDYQRQISDSYFTADFWYRNTFTVDKSMEGKRIWLNFNSINWKAGIYINGHYLGRIEGAFIRGKFEVTKYLRFGEENHIVVYIMKNCNPGHVYEKTMQETGPNGGILGADNPTIHPSVGWDWVPVIRGRNIGIYGDVYLSSAKDFLIEDPFITTRINKDGSASAELKAYICSNADDEGMVLVSGYIEPVMMSSSSDMTQLIDNGITEPPISFEASIYLNAGEVKEVIISDIKIPDARLWYPNGYGEQYLYKAFVQISDDRGVISDKKSFQFGVREITYLFKPHLEIHVNGTRIYCRGGNWGMDDSNLEASPEDYDIKVRLHAEENFTMIRNWVGQTNHDAFYDACDKYGILIWDDFWLANPGDGPVPSDEAVFMKNAYDKVKRVRGHASLALYCGRNEGNPPESLDKKLRELVAELDKDKLYISHSAALVVSGFGPYSVKDPVYYFNDAPVTLHSERGMPNIPTIESIKRMIPKDYLWPVNEMWALHDFTLGSAQGGASFIENMEKYGTFDSLETFSRYAQMVNYENHKAMFEGVIVNKSNGLLMWMSQSAWPSMVWQTYDYYYDTNAAFFAIKTANQPVNPIWNPVSKQVVLTNHTTKELIDVTVKMEVYGLNGRMLDSVSGIVSVKSADVSSIDGCKLFGNDVVFIRTKAFSREGRQIGENFYWTNPCQYQDYKELGCMGDAVLKGHAGLISRDLETIKYNVYIKNISEMPALLIRVRTTKGIDGEQILPVYYEDNYFSLMPGEEKEVTVQYDGKYAEGMEAVFSVDGFNAELTWLEMDA